MERVDGVGTASPTYTLEFIRENSSVPLLSRTGGIAGIPAEASEQNFNNSESRNRFIFYSGYTTGKFYNGATLENLRCRHDHPTGTWRITRLRRI